jgi:hypothetical protein
MPKQPKKNFDGRVYRDIVCPGCNTVLGSEYIFRGRLRLRCSGCDRIMVMVFRQRKESKRSNQGNTN